MLAIPLKRFDKTSVSFFDDRDVTALLAAPGRATWQGRRDHTLLLVAIQTGLRISEVLSFDRGDVTLGTGAHLRCEARGRKHRAVPLTAPFGAALRVWVTERRGLPGDPVFPTRIGRRLSRDAVQRRVIVHAATAVTRCPSLQGRKLSPHGFRHTSAMNLLHAGVDTTVIALWLGHADVRSTNAYLHAELAIRTRPRPRHPDHASAGRYRPPDQLLTFLGTL